MGPCRAFFLALFSAQACFGQFSLVSVGHDTNLPGNFAASIALSGNYAYVLSPSGLSVVDVSDPVNPITVGSTNTGGHRLAISGNYAYVENNFNGLRTFDISDPAHPVSVSLTNDHVDANCIAASTNRVCLFANYSGMRYYDLADPARPAGAGATNTGPYGYGGALQGNYAFIGGMFVSAGTYSILRIYDFSNPANPVYAGGIRYSNSSYANDVALSGGYAYLAGGSNAATCFWVCDVSNPANPFTVARIDPGVYASRIVVSGNYAYLMAGQRMRIFDVSIPAQPRDAGTLDVGPQTVSDLAVSGNYVYVPKGADGLRIYLLVPQLGITLGGPDNISVSWSAPPAGGWELQQKTEVPSTNWQTVTNTPVISSNRVEVLLPRTGASQFFRLKYQ